MEDYLKYTRRALSDLSIYRKVHVILGNEACDLDSTVAAIVYAYYLHKTKHVESCIFLPILNIPRCDYNLRTETTYFLGNNSITPDHLIFRDELDLSFLYNEDRLDLTIVDHNVLPPCDHRLECTVSEVIDHHQLQREKSDGCQITLELVGSCCTLIAEKIFNGEDVDLDPLVYLLLYGTILVDTMNLSPEAGRATPRDEYFIQRLKSYLKDINGDELFDLIQEAKYDITGLTNLELLKKDVKMAKGEHLSVAVSSVTMDMKELLNRRDFQSCLESFREEVDVNVVVIMTIQALDPNFPRRQLAIYTTSDKIRQEISEVLEKHSDPSLHLKLQETELLYTHVYTQNNVKASRKIVLPVIKSLTQTFGKTTVNKEPRIQPESFCGDEGALDLKDSASDVEMNSPNGEKDECLSGGCEPKKEEGEENYNVNAHIDNNPQVNDFIDNLVNINVDNAIAEVNNFNVEHADGVSSTGNLSPMEMSSGQPSRGSSYPATPPNSLMDVGFDRLMKEHHLPSFNNSEMVQRIKDKKASLTADTYSNQTSGHTSDAEGGDIISFTPPNSLTNSSMEAFAKEHILPSFQNEDMIEKIKHGRKSFEYNDVDSDESSSDTFPFTPKDDFVDTIFDQDVHDTKPSYGNSEMNQKVAGKRVTIKDYDDDSPSSEELSTNFKGVKGSSYSMSTDSNSDASPDGMSNELDATALQKLAETFGMSSSPRNTQGQSKKKVVQHFDEKQANIIASDFADELIKQSVDIVHNDLQNKNTTQTKERCVGNKCENNDIMNDDTSASSPSDIEEISYSLAQHLIESALENFPVTADYIGAIEEQDSSHNSSELTNAGNVALDSQNNMNPTDTGGDSVSQSKLTINVDSSPLKKTKSSADIDVETNYLPSCDPLHGNLGFSNSDGGAIETSAEKEVAEDIGFRKFSGDTSEEDQKKVIAAHYKTDQDNPEQTEKFSFSFNDYDDDSSTEYSSTTTEGSYRIYSSSEASPNHASNPMLHAIYENEDGNHNEHPQKQGLSEASKGDSSVSVRRKIPVAGAPLDKEKKEFYNTTAGRISLNSDFSEDNYHMQHFSTGSDSVIDEESDTQVENDSEKKDSQSEKTPTARLSSTGTQQAKERMKEVEFNDEWQEDEMYDKLEDTGEPKRRKVRPDSLNTQAGDLKRKIKPNISIGTDEDAGSDIPDDIDDLKTPDDLETPEDLDNTLGELEWENDTPVKSPDSEPIPEYSAEDEWKDGHSWKRIVVADKEFRLDLRVIEPYKKVISHGGYYGDGLNAIIIFSGCHMPDRGRKDYHYVMDNLFLYVINTLETLVAEDYMIIYFHGATPKKQMPSFGWFKKCYRMIDRRLRKNLKGLLLVHPTLWLRTIVMMTRPFISSKFSSKLKFVKTLQELSQIVPMEYVFVPDQVKMYDDEIMRRRSSSSTASTPTSEPISPR